MQKTINVLSVIVVLLFFSSCRKSDLTPKDFQHAKVDNVETPILQREGDRDLHQKVVDYLHHYQDTVSAYQASKIDTLLTNLVDSNLIVFSLDDSTNVIACDLSAYKNPSVPAYSNTFYKAYFTVINGQMDGGIYFTIHTNLSKASVDADLGNIIFNQSTSFTGITATNYLNDKFFQESIYSSGHLDENYRLSPVDLKGERGVTNEDCTIYYVVHTTIWLSGKIDREITASFTLCGNCIPTGTRVSTIETDCDPGSGGGGGPITIEKIPCGPLWIPLADNGSCGVTMLHCYEIYDGHYGKQIDAHPATPDNPYVFDCTYLGKSTKRWAKPSDHHPSMQPYSANSMRIKWNYDVFYLYTWNNEPSNFPVYETPGYYVKIVKL